MRTEDPRPIRLKDYTPPAFKVDEVRLEIELDPADTRVRSQLKMRRNAGTGPLVLDGEKLKLHEISIDGVKLGPNA